MLIVSHSCIVAGVCQWKGSDVYLGLDNKKKGFLKMTLQNTFFNLSAYMKSIFRMMRCADFQDIKDTLSTIFLRYVGRSLRVDSH